MNNEQIFILRGEEYSMKNKLKLFIILLAAIFVVKSTVIPALAEEIPEEETDAFNAVLIPAEGKTDDKFTNNDFNKFYKVSLKEEGKLRVSFSSAKMKGQVVIKLFYDKESSAGVSKELTYNKKKKITKGTITSEYIMSPGDYYILVQPADQGYMIGKKPVKYTITTKFTRVKFDDQEPNTMESEAQKMTLKEINKKQKVYTMRLSYNGGFQDKTDTFKFSLKLKKAVSFKITMKEKAKLRVMLKHIDENGFTSIVNSEEDQYIVSDGEKVTLDFGTKKLLTKGNYYLSVVLVEGKDTDITYQISASTYTPIKKIKVKESKINLNYGTSKTIKYSLNQGATEPVSFKSKNSSIVTVSSSGKLTPKKKGSTTITITSKYTRKKAVVKVNVTGVAVKSIELNKDKVTLNKGMTINLKAIVKPDKASNKKVVWSSSNKKAAKVSDNGKVTAVGIGKAVIKATARDGSKKYGQCTVIVKKKKITLSAYSKTINAGDGFWLKAKGNADKTEKIIWVTSDPDVASISQKGYVYGKKSGTAYIYAKAEDGTKSKSCKVVVQKVSIPDNNTNNDNSDQTETPPAEETKLTISSESSSVKVGGSITLTASISGGTWSASGSGKVSISGNGGKCTVTGVSEGTVYITYKVNGKSAQVSIYVRN